jgi:hypothetical protein
MKKSILLSAVMLMAGTLFAADSEDVKAAAKKLADQSSYGWKTTVVVPEGSRFRPGPTEGKTEKDGYTWLSMSFGDNSTEAIIKGEKGAAKLEGEWKSLAEMADDGGQPGSGTFMARMLRSYRTPAVEAEDLAGKTKDLKKDGDVFVADLSEDGAKELLRFRGGRRAGGDGPPPAKNAKGSVKFWVKNGQLAKFEYKVSGTITFNGEDRDIDRTTTVEIKDVGTAKIEVPGDAKKKLESKA